MLDKKNGRKKFLLFVKDKVAEAYFCQGDRGERRSGHFSFSADLESGVQLTFPELGKTNSLRIQEVYQIRLRDKCFSLLGQLKFVFQMGLTVAAG